MNSVAYNNDKYAAHKGYGIAKHKNESQYSIILDGVSNNHSV